MNYKRIVLMPLIAIAALIGPAACGGGGGGSAPPGGGGGSSRLDLACDTDGWLTYNYYGYLGFNTDDSIRAVVVQPDDKIIVGGYARYSASDDDFALARFNADCTLDTTFTSSAAGVGHFGGTSNDQIHALARQADGKIVAVGSTQWTGTTTGSNRNFALARYTSGGVLDTTFGSGGMVVTEVSGCSGVGLCGDEEAFAVAIQADGKIVVAGYYSDLVTPLRWYFAVARYNTNGTLDTTFGAGGGLFGTGIVRTSIYGEDTARAIAIQTDGKIVVAGEAMNIAAGTIDFALVRYTSAGALDTTFDTDGKVTTSFGATSGAFAMVLQPTDGKIVVAGDSNGDTVLARYNSNGTLDTNFGGGDGWTLDTTLTARAVALQADGKIVLAGRAVISGDVRFAVARYNADGSLDSGYGVVTTDFGTLNDRASAVAIQSDGKIIAAGSSGGDFAMARFLP
jgi:uncharacterized delta-60 repeat protein